MEADEQNMSVEQKSAVGRKESVCQSVKMSAANNERMMEESSNLGAVCWSKNDEVQKKRLGAKNRVKPSHQHEHENESDSKLNQIIQQNGRTTAGVLCCFSRSADTYRCGH